MCLSDESKESKVVLYKKKTLSRLTSSLHEHSLLGFTKRNNSKQWGHTSDCCFMSVLLEHMNVMLEEN